MAELVKSSIEANKQMQESASKSIPAIVRYKNGLGLFGMADKVVFSLLMDDTMGLYNLYIR